MTLPSPETNSSTGLFHSRPPKIPTSLDTLPLEILLHIASFLDVRSALALAQTASALTDPAESRIWRDLVISRPRLHTDWVEALLTRTSKTADAQAKMAGIPPAVEAYGIVRFYLDALQARPSRRGYVRNITLDDRQRIPLNFGRLLDMVSASVRELHLSPAAMSLTRGREHYMSPLDLFRSVTAPLTGLRKVSITITSSWHATVSSLLTAAPNLVVLRLWDRLAPSELRDSRVLVGLPWEIPPLPRMEQLIVDDMNEAFGPLLALVVEHAPGLQGVVIRDQGFKWRP
jgi:hypothetical protein